MFLVKWHNGYFPWKLTGESSQVHKYCLWIFFWQNMDILGQLWIVHFGGLKIVPVDILMKISSLEIKLYITKAGILYDIKI